MWSIGEIITISSLIVIVGILIGALYYVYNEDDFYDRQREDGSRNSENV